MKIKRRTLLGTTAAIAGSLPLRRARAQAAATIRLGALTDMSGPYRDVEGPTGTACARQAAAEFMAANPGVTVEFIVADHQNKPDVATSIVRQWFDRDGVDALVQVGNTAVALAANTVARDKDKVHLNTGALSSTLTGQYCTPNLVHGPLDTWALAHSTATALTKQGGTNWFFITADYAYGHALQDDTARFVKASGASIAGSVAYPFPGTTDFSSLLLQAQSSGAKVLALATSGSDVVNCVKQAKEFGLDRSGIRIAGLGTFLSDVMAMGLAIAGGLAVTESFYWDLNDRTRALYGRVKPHLGANVYPGSLHAGAYAATVHYLKAVKAMGVAEARKSGRATVEVMKRMPTDDDAFGPGQVRADGQMIAPVHLFQVKTPGESTGGGDVFRLVATTPADQAFRPLPEGGCPMLHR